MNKPRRWHKLIAWLTLALLIAVLTGPYAIDRCYNHYFFDGFSTIKFDSSQWKSSIPIRTYDSKRLRMVDDLLNKFELVNQKRSYLIALLGEPDKTPYFRNYDMVYFLGPERSILGIDSEWLVIELNDAGISTVAVIATD